MIENNISTLGWAINQFLSKSKLQDKLLHYKIESNWHTIVGGLIAKNTEKIQFFEHKLFILTHSAPLKQELNLNKERIKTLVNEKLKQNAVYEVIIQ